MTFPDKPTALNMLKEWAGAEAQIDRAIEDLEKAVGSTIDSPVFNAAWKTFDLYTDALSAALGDAEEWLAWYWGVNDMGKRAHRAGYGQNMKPIKNLEDLYGLILEGRERTAA